MAYGLIVADCTGNNYRLIS